MAQIPEEYEPNYTPDDLPASITFGELVKVVNDLRTQINQLLKITGLTNMRLADWKDRNYPYGSSDSDETQG